MTYPTENDPPCAFTLTPLERQAVQAAAEIFGPTNEDLFAVVESIVERHLRERASR